MFKSGGVLVGVKKGRFLNLNWWAVEPEGRPRWGVAH